MNKLKKLLKVQLIDEVLSLRIKNRELKKKFIELETKSVNEVFRLKSQLKTHEETV